MNHADAPQQPHTAAHAIRDAIARESYEFHLLYVDCQLNDFEHWETERSMIKTEGAIEALQQLAADTAVLEEVRAAEEDGKRRLGAYMSDLLVNGSDYIAGLEKNIEEAAADAERANELRANRSSLEEDLSMANEVLAYLAGEDIQRG